MKQVWTTMVVAVSIAGLASGAVVIDIEQDGDNVVASGSGTLDLTGLTFEQGEISAYGINPGEAFVAVGYGYIGKYTEYVGITTSPADFGTGDFTSPNGTSSPGLAVNGLEGSVYVPQGFESGGSLSGSATFNDTTIAGLGLTPGSYVYSWGADSVTVNIVPEPATMGLLSVGAVALLRRHKRTA